MSHSQRLRQTVKVACVASLTLEEIPQGRDIKGLPQRIPTLEVATVSLGFKVVPIQFHWNVIFDHS